MLSTLNVWSDIIGNILIIAALSVPLLFLVTNTKAGRFQERILNNHWHVLEAIHEPWDEESPMPIRIWHFINICCFIVFLLSGFYFRYSFYDGGRLTMQYLHYVAMYACIGAWVYRMWFMFTTNDGKNNFFNFDKSDINTFIQNALYYATLAKNYPHLKKYHPLQRITYISIYVLILVQAYTGLSLLWPQLLFWVPSGIASPALAVAYARFIHSILMRLFLLLAGAHATFTIYETLPATMYFWFGIESPLPNVHEHGHGEHAKEH